MPEPKNRRSFLERHRFWFLTALTAALVLVLAQLTPEQLPVLHYKLCLPMLGGVNGYWLDRALFPFAEPSGYLWEDWLRSGGSGTDGEPDYPVARGYELVFALACLRQVLLVCAGALAVSLGL